MTRKKHPGRYRGPGHRDLALLTVMEQMTCEGLGRATVQRLGIEGCSDERPLSDVLHTITFGIYRDAHR